MFCQIENKVRQSIVKENPKIMPFGTNVVGHCVWYFEFGSLEFV